MFSPQERQDKVIRSTDLDALGCRYSATTKNYLQDEYIKFLIKTYELYLHLTPGYTSMSAARFLKTCFHTPKLPLINRGTYIRTRAIDQIIDQFISSSNSKCQIVSLGSGSDTRVFKLLKQHSNLAYHEIDFAHSTKIKTLAIMNNSSLSNIIFSEDDEKTVPLTDEKITKEEYQAYPFEIHSSRYHLHGFDLRELNLLEDSIEDRFHIDPELPTLIISECVLCYLSPEETSFILKFWKNSIKSGFFLTYDPLSNGDNFGQVMIKNLSSRGISLPSFEMFPTIDSRLKYFKNNIGLSDLKLSNMTFIMDNWISTDELNRINRLEMLDELEEINLLNDHYVLCVGLFGGLRFDVKKKFMIED